MKSLVAPGRAKAPPYHEIAFGGVEVGFVEAAKQPLPWVVARTAQETGAPSEHYWR